MQPVKVIGAGLAGSEAAWQLVKRGVPVQLYEMRPKKSSPAHHSADFAELVCFTIVPEPLARLIGFPLGIKISPFMKK